MTNLYSEAHEIMPLTADISPRTSGHSLLLGEGRKQKVGTAQNMGN